MKKIPLLSIAVSSGTYAEFAEEILRCAGQGQSQYVCVANVHMLVEGHQHPEFGALVKRADIITPDGKPLVWALRLLYGIRQERVAGMDLLPDLLRESELENIPVYFYGGTDEMLARTEKFLQQKYPRLQLAGSYSPPFRNLTAEEDLQVIERIHQSGAKLIFVILGCPKQEKWMASMKGKIKGVTIGVGGALPVLLGMQQRAPRWMQRIGMEWLYRLGQEPRRLFKRYAVTNTLFLYLLAKELIFRKRTAHRDPKPQNN